MTIDAQISNDLIISNVHFINTAPDTWVHCPKYGRFTLKRLGHGHFVLTSGDYEWHGSSAGELVDREIINTRWWLKQTQAKYLAAKAGGPVIWSRDIRK